MGGKNFAVVMDDADLKQAVLEVLQGAFLTTGQRCTATSRVLIHEGIFDTFSQVLLAATKKLAPVKASEEGVFGPLASKGSQEKFIDALKRAKAEGVKVMLDSKTLDGGAFVTPSIYHAQNTHPSNGFLSEEIFGPNICLESFSELDHAIDRINESPFGLSNSIFTLDKNNFEKLYRETKCGVLNLNRSTNGAYGQMPFGGIGKSGNQRPAGIDAVKYTTYPVAISSLAYGESAAPSSFKNLIDDIKDDIAVDKIHLRHKIEAIFEQFGINTELAAHEKVIFLKKSFNGLKNHEVSFFGELKEIFSNELRISHNQLTFSLNKVSDHNHFCEQLNSFLERYSQMCGLEIRLHTPLKMNVPKDLETPRSRAMLDRLYRKNFVPKEKKTLVADLYKSKGAYLASVDENPLVLFDAASQIATLGAGFMADTYINSYEVGEFDLSLAKNFDLSLEHNCGCDFLADAVESKNSFENLLSEKSDGQFKSFGYGAGGSEANEIAFDLCRQNGPGGTKIIAFEGSFHGRTLMPLQATYNKEKRGPFAFSGYEAIFLPFPKLLDPDKQPQVDQSVLKKLSNGEVPSADTNDQTLNQELGSLQELKNHAQKNKLCCVIVEPMQCEGGDNYASNRFFNYLRALTRGLKIPLVFDEIQTGFNLGREFFWHSQFELKDQNGKRENPDCITLGKKAQLGVCMSVWPNERDYTPHVIQLKRGYLHAQAIDKNIALALEGKAKKELMLLKEYFPELVKNSRACGFAFAFEMPSKGLAMNLINQRFHRGFMAYIAGEKTLRFRLNMITEPKIINRLFEKLFVALSDLREGVETKARGTANLKVVDNSILDRVSDIKIETLTKDNFKNYQQEIVRIENDAFEEGRRDTADSLISWLSQDYSLGLALICKYGGKKILAGYAIGGPLEHSQAQGPNDDPNLLKHNTFYSADITVNKRFRGCGFGSRLKAEQIRRLANYKNDSGEKRYHYLSGRNRIEKSHAMTKIVENLGAYGVKVYDDQYGQKGVKALYYRLPLSKTEHKISNC